MRARQRRAAAPLQPADVVGRLCRSAASRASALLPSHATRREPAPQVAGSRGLLARSRRSSQPWQWQCAFEPPHTPLAEQHGSGESTSQRLARPVFAACLPHSRPSPAHPLVKCGNSRIIHPPELLSSSCTASSRIRASAESLRRAIQACPVIPSRKTASSTSRSPL